CQQHGNWPQLTC
nr:immunoglobulin light chain junction region [Macaca mulatta]MPN94883.1 immunoglobulin light chain junction region [Macaca mulatta]MPN96639.1 immunoglobulin light chain junction region [Macaca mulatta]MPN97094.1 immunoglobulin light chain junction region [Macaca mulatta]MPN98898.1 immunoglobulin light chain junction region [Macaca mulatta]